MVFTILFDEEFKPFDGNIRHVSQVVVDAINFFFDTCEQFVGLIFAKLKNALHFDFHQSHDVIASQFSNKVGFERRQSVVDVFNSGIHIFGIFKLFIFIDAFFDKDFFERREEKLFKQFVFSYL